MPMKWLLWVAGIVCGLCVICYLFFPIKYKNLVIHTNMGSYTYQVDIANTPAQQQKGLMFQKSMPPHRGMLFDFHKPQPIMMWMKNTYISLDMLFLDSAGTIVWVYENARPMDETIIACPYPVQYVIELNAGQVFKRKIRVGDRVDLP